MKNIFLSPTDKPSRFSLNSIGKYHLTNQLHTNSRNFTNQYIYITSDEEIKEGEWCINLVTKNIVLCSENFSYYGDWKKIILTTDQDLIKDGVQAIDNEFLEWFVKNPSCEKVEIKMENYYASGALQPNLWQYKIIIPKEEPKQDNCCTPIGQIKRYVDCVGCDKKPRQETFEEAAAKHFNEEIFVEGVTIQYALQEAFIIGAKWQAERMYSEEEVIEILHSRMRYTLGEDYKEVTTIKWFEQFKNKTL